MAQEITGSDLRLRDAVHSCEHTCILFHIIHYIYGMCGSMGMRMIQHHCSIAVYMDIQNSVW